MSEWPLAISQYSRRIMLHVFFFLQRTTQDGNAARVHCLKQIQREKVLTKAAQALCTPFAVTVGKSELDVCIRTFLFAGKWEEAVRYEQHRTRKCSTHAVLMLLILHPTYFVTAHLQVGTTSSLTSVYSTYKVLLDKPGLPVKLLCYTTILDHCKLQYL